MTLRNALLATVMLALPIAAQAQPVNGVYVAGGAGANWRGDTSFSFAPVGAPFGTQPDGRFTVQSSLGWVGVGSVGWGFGNGLRVELEGNYRNNAVDQISATVVSATPQLTQRTGSLTTYGVMVNALYDIGATQGWPVHISLGGGIGYAWNRWSNVGGYTYEPFFERVNINGTTGAFAWQLIAGLSLPVRAVPGLAITAEYRYFATLDADQTVSASAFRTSQLNARSIAMSNDNQSVLLGVRYNFGRAPAAPPPVAAPAPATSFIVFFDFNRSDLTARAREIVAQAAAAARTAQVTRIEVAGHTDTVGSAQYNLGLSQRRANTVAAELVRLGVPRQAISTAGYGFSRPLVPTGPNVREPQNRRVEIVFR